MNNSWQKILLEVSQGSMLGPLLFNIGIYDLFLNMEDCDVANYMDDNASY